MHTKPIEINKSSQPKFNVGYTFVCTRLRAVIIARAASGVVAAKKTTARSRLLCGTGAKGFLEVLRASRSVSIAERVINEHQHRGRVNEALRYFVSELLGK